MRSTLILAACLLPVAYPSFGQTEEKNSWVALGLSSLLPGAGQLYNEEPHKAILMASGGLAGYLMIHQASEDNGEYCTATFNSIRYTREDFTACHEWMIRQIAESRGNWTARATATTDHDFDDDDGRATAGAWIYLGVWAWSMIDAKRSANRINAEAQSQSALDVVPVVTPGRAGARVVLRF